MEQVNVTFTPLNGNFQPAERILELTSDRRSVRIGRASKSPTKGLVSAVDNAWFDSPVMSRDHAEVVFDTLKNAVTIQDIGSMHGTYHVAGGTLQGTSRLESGEVRILETGDTLTFGIEVKRGLETFPACSFRVGLKYLELPKNSYSHPEPLSDAEDEEYDDLEASSNNAPSSLDGVSVDSVKPPKVLQPIDAIDLTQDEPVALSPYSRTFQELASQIYSVDNDDEESYSSDSEHSDVVDCYDVSDNSDGDDEEHDRSSNDESPRATSVLSRTSVADVTEASGLLDDLWSSSADESDQSDFGLSDAGREGLEVLFDNDLLSNDRAASLDLDEDENVDNNEDEGKSQDLDDRYVPRQPSADIEMCKIVRPAVDIVVSNQAPSTFREPSPSDAAMVKPATVTTHVKYSASPINEWQGLNLLDSDEKSRKEAFFEARVLNKARFDRSEELGEAFIPPPSAPSLAFTPSTAVDQEIPGRRFPLPLVPGTSAWPLGFVEDTQLPKLNYLDDHSSIPHVEIEQPTSEFDMSSAVKFNESRALNASQTPLCTGRSGLSICDIIEVPKSVKRKADEISDVVGDEIRMWASVPGTKATTNLETATALPISNPKVGASINDQATSSEVEPRTERRQVKRLRMCVERLGFAALGGAAVGAGLFSVLVATAPNYL